MKMKVLLTAGMTLVLAGCGGSSGGGVADACNELSTESFSCETMLTDVVAEGVAPLVESLDAGLIDLDAKVVEYCADISDPTNLANAKDAWTAVMASMQQLLPMNFGPNLDIDNGLLTFYDWQTASPFNIDIAIAQRARFPETVTLPVASNEKDLVAIEYILFDYAAIQAYDDPTKENSNVKAWRESKVTDAEIQQDRCEYATLVTSSLKTKASGLKASWQQYDLASVSSNKQNSANEVAKALFYIDKVTKDAKIKAALPQYNDATTGFFADKLESQFAKQSKEGLLNNLIGAKRLFTLNDIDNSKAGLDDYLVAAGQSDVADDMLAALDAAIANVEAIDNPGVIYDAVNNAMDEGACTSASGNGTYGDGTNMADSSDIVTFCALQYQVKAFTDILKGKFTFLTSFTIPASASGDND